MPKAEMEISTPLEAHFIKKIILPELLFIP